MSRERVRDAQPEFTGGLNTVADAAKLEQHEVRQALNVRLTEQGAATKRSGSRRLTEAAFAGDVQGGYGWQLPGGTVELVIADGTLYVGTNTFGATFTETAYVGADVGFASTAVPIFASFLDASGDVAVYIADGGPLKKYRQTEGLEVLATPNVSFITVYNRRLFGVNGTDEVLLASGLNDGDSLGLPLDGGIEAVVRTFSDQRLTALASYRNDLYLFHVTGVSRFTGVSQDDIEITAGSQGITSDVGTLAPRSVVAIENGVFFLSDRGMYVISGGQVLPASVKIDNVFAGMSAAEHPQVCSVHNRAKREVWFFLPGRGVYVVAYRGGGWAGPYTGGLLAPELTCMWESTDSFGVPVIAGGDVDGWVRRLDVDGLALDNVTSAGTGGDTYRMFIQFRRQFHGEMSTEKSYRWAYVLADLQGSDTAKFFWANRVVEAEYEFPGGVAWNDPETTWGEGTWGGDALLMYRVPIHGRGPFTDFYFEEQSASIPVISRMESEAFNLGRRGN